MKPKPKFDPSQPLANPRHEAFVQAVLEGLTQADGYRMAGYKASNPDTVYTEAYRLMQHPQISPRLDYLRTKAADESVLTKAWLIQETLNTYAQARAAGAFNAALKALQMLGRKPKPTRRRDYDPDDGDAGWFEVSSA